jgi:uncharacterized membrane protein YedE/YeeE
VRSVAAFVVGATFALGLGIGGMTSPERVLAFLDVTGAWDPSLAFVMLGAVLVYGTTFRLVVRRERPLLAPTFAVPTRKDIDARLIGGAVTFGVGWGLAGLCPGPALTALASGHPRIVVFLAAMVAGIAAHKAVERGLAGRAAPDAAPAGSPVATRDHRAC